MLDRMPLTNIFLAVADPQVILGCFKIMTDGSSTTNSSPGRYQYRANCCKTRAYPEAAERLLGSAWSPGIFINAVTVPRIFPDEDLVLFVAFLYQQSSGIYFFALEAAHENEPRLAA